MSSAIRAAGPPFDLHLHTIASDGSLTPADLVARGQEAGATVLAITDHDTADGVTEALRAGQQLSLTVIPGVELSAEYAGELHILGYGIDPNHSALKVFLAQQRERRNDRLPRMVENLRKTGIPITEQEVVAQAHGDVAGRLHVAQALVARGAANTVQDAFHRFLVAGRPGYAPREKASARQCVEIIMKAGGEAVLAHPGLMNLNQGGLRGLVSQLKGYGLAGLEAFYPAHGLQQARDLCDLAREYGLISTYGSDFHGADRSAILGDWQRFAADIPEQTYRWMQRIIGE